MFKDELGDGDVTLLRFTLPIPNHLNAWQVGVQVSFVNRLCFPQGEITTVGTEQEVRTILKSTFSTCPVGVIFERAGIIPTYDLTIRKPAAA